MPDAFAAPRATVLETRGLLVLTGPDRARFLQGLVSNDITRVGPDRAAYAALLTPQGKMLFDLMLVGYQSAGGAGDDGGALLIEAEAARLDDLRTRLTKFKLRSKIGLDRDKDLAVAVVFGDGALDMLDLPVEPGAARALSSGGVAFVDPRLAGAGARLILPAKQAREILLALGAESADAAAWERHRLSLGLPENAPDIGVEKSLPLECGFEELNGVDFRKGCYMGQELTARTKHRGLLKRRLMPVEVDGPLPPPGTPVLTGAGKDGGEMRSGLALNETSGLGLAIVRLEAFSNRRQLWAGEARLTPRVPDWMALPEGARTSE